MKHWLFLVMIAAGIKCGASETKASAPDTVVSHLPAGFSRKAAEIRAARGITLALSATEVLRRVEDSYDFARRTGESAFLNFAESALTPFVEAQSPSPRALLLRAALQQQRHDFTNALHTLKRIDRLPQARLMELSILETLGRFDEARSLCQASPLIASTSSGFALLCQLASMTGDLGKATEMLSQQLNARSTERGPEAAFAWTILAEMQFRQRGCDAAEAAFHRALSSATAPEIYLASAYADFLIARGRPGEALEFLNASPLREQLLLRRAIALRKLSVRTEELQELIGQCEGQFYRSAAHLREQAMIELYLHQNPIKALRKALENWEVQKEPADLRLVLEAAFAAKRPGLLDPILHWMKKWKYEDASVPSPVLACAP